MLGDLIKQPVPDPQACAPFCSSDILFAFVVLLIIFTAALTLLTYGMMLRSPKSKGQYLKDPIVAAITKI